MEGEEQHSEQEGSFSKASIPKRMAIVAAGAFVNIVFGLLIYFLLMTGTGNFISRQVDDVLEGYPAQQDGIKAADEIIAINGNKIHLKQDLDKQLQQTQGKEMKVTIKREGKQQEIITIPTERKQKTTGIYLSLSGKHPTQIVQIDENSSAQKQGLRVDDIILKINGEEIGQDQQKIMSLIQKEGVNTLLFTVQRGEEQLTIEVTPDITPIYELGVILKKADNTLLNRIYYGYWETISFTSSIMDNLKMLFTGKVGLDQMMGPVGISSVVSETEGIYDFIYILALISLSLGVTNLLPIPALDGGKLLLLLIEAIRRKPLSEKVEIGIQMIGFFLLIGLSIFITYQDILRIV